MQLTCGLGAAGLAHAWQERGGSRVSHPCSRMTRVGSQVGWGLLDWLTPGGTAAAAAWLAALSLAPLARAGRLPFVRLLTPESAGDVETGGTLRIVNGVLERR